MDSNQSLIHQKIKEFVQKYYLNKLYKGAIFFVMITLITFIIYALLEYFSYFTTPVRTVLFYSYVTLFAATLIFYVIIPLVKLAGYGKQISNEQIADIIGRHFPEIDDKLLNIFQLEKLFITVVMQTLHTLKLSGLIQKKSQRTMLKSSLASVMVS